MAGGGRRPAPADMERGGGGGGGKSSASSSRGAYAGWEGANFPLSKLDLTKLTRDYSKIRHSPRSSSFSSAAARRRHPKGGIIVSPRRHDHFPRTSSSSSSGNLKLVSKSEHGWSWLSVQFREIRGNKHLQAKHHHGRNGELAPALVDAIWGASKNVRLCRQPLQTLKALGNSKGNGVASFIDTELEIKKIRAQRQAKNAEVRPEDSLMDILLHNWTYFEHSHTKSGSTDKQIHAKYCENEFGHFLLADGQQIHGQFNIQLHVLVKKLKKLLQKLRSQILPTSYQEIPAWRSPRLEEDPELEMPRMPPMPQLYPIAGLKPIPTEQEENIIPDDYPAPVFKSPVPKEHPPLILPEPLNVPPLQLPVMSVIVDDESKIDYESYKEESLPVFKLPPQEPLPTWVEPHLTELPPEPVYLSPPIFPTPIMDTIPTFRPPPMDCRPCEKSYYELGKDERGICDGLCSSKHGHGHKKKHQFVPAAGHNRRDTSCVAQPPPLLSLPLPPFPEAESHLMDMDDHDLKLENLRIVPEPVLELPAEVPVPAFDPPALKVEPVYVPLPPPPVPTWKPPKPPPPLGWMAGQRPVFLIDCSAAMGADRLEAVQNCLNALFSPGGQGDVAISHFDIIMYSFDAWSFGDIENSYAYKQGSGPRYSRLLEPMRMKTTETVNAALHWVSRWRPAGASNLSKALEIAISRSFADCIYLFSEGRADKPVPILESLKRRAQTGGGAGIPIHTVAVKSSKLRSHFLKRLSTVSGGQFMELGAHLRQVGSGAAAEMSDDDADDMAWAQREVEQRQRRCAVSGIPARIPDILKDVERDYDVSRRNLRMEIHKQKARDHEATHREEVRRIQSENAAALLQATQAHEARAAEIREQNKRRTEEAEAAWREATAAARERNAKMVHELVEWTAETRRVKEQNGRSVAAARGRFKEDVKEVEERNAARLRVAEEQHAAEAERIRQRHKEAVEETARRQKESDEKVAAMNRAAEEEHRAEVAAIRESNAALLAQTQRMYEERLCRVKAYNARILQEAQASFEARCEDVRAENARKKAALAEMLVEIRRRKEEALAAHKADVMRTIAEHEQMMKSYAAMNAENEEKARGMWAEACEEVDKENMAAAQRTMAEFEAERRRVQVENVKLAERRLALKRKAAEIVKQNEEVVRKKKEEWKAACEAVEAAYEEEVAAAKAAQEVRVQEVKRRNAEKLQASLLEHKAKVAAAESYNETVRPYVAASDAVRAEVRRVEAFLQCVADSILPPDRHIMEKNPLKSALDKDLDLLAVSTATLTTDTLIDALRSAYGKSWRGPAANSQKTKKMSVAPASRSRFSGLVPIHPARVPPHSCREPGDDDGNGARA